MDRSDHQLEMSIATADLVETAHDIRETLRDIRLILAFSLLSLIILTGLFVYLFVAAGQAFAQVASGG